MLASSYHDMNYVMETDYTDGLQLIAKARENRNEARRWQLYCGVYPHMNKDNFIPFESFNNNKQQKTVTRRTKEQIRDEANGLKQLFGKG